MLVAIALTLFLTTLLSSRGQDCKHMTGIAVTFPPSSRLVAGERYSFTVTLYDSNSEPVCSLYDPLLAVTCLSGDQSGLDSFCEPNLIPTSPGAYKITLIPRTLWGGHHGWPPSFNPTAPLPDTYFSGNTSIQVTYDGVDAPGSPYPIFVEASDISTAYATVNVASPAKGVAMTTFPVARFYQITDEYTNWIRNPTIIDRLQVRCSSEDVTMTMRWWLNWWIEILASSRRSGVYTFQLFLIHEDGSQEPLRVQTPRGLSYEGTFEILPHAIDDTRFTVYGVPEQAGAGSEFLIFAQAMDQFSNPTPVIDPAQYLPLFTQVENVSLLQIIVKQRSQPTASLQPHIISMLTNTTGLLNWLVTCHTSGLYDLSIMYMAQSIYEGIFLVVPAGPDLNTSRADVPDTVSAGTVYIRAKLRDPWGNPTFVTDSLQVSAVDQDNITLAVYGPDFFADFVSYSVVMAVAGVSMVRLLLGSALFAIANVTVRPQMVMSLSRSQVAGYGAGSPFSTLEDRATPIIAGREYHVWVKAKDMYGNTMTVDESTAMLSVEGPGEVEKAVLCHPDGTIQFIYRLAVTGMHTLSVRNNQGVLHSGSLLVYADVAYLPSTSISFPQLQVAGVSMNVTVKFFDKLGNVAGLTGTLSAIFQDYDGLSSVITENHVDGVSGAVNIVLTKAGLHNVACFFNGAMLGSEALLVEVQAATPIRANASIHGSTAGLLSFDAQLFDGYWNPITNSTAIQDISVSISPNLLWEANVTYFPKAGIRIFIWSGPYPGPGLEAYTVSLLYQSTTLMMYNWSLRSFIEDEQAQGSHQELRLLALFTGLPCLVGALALALYSVNLTTRPVAGGVVPRSTFKNRR